MQTTVLKRNFMSYLISSASGIVGVFLYYIFSSQLTFGLAVAMIFFWLLMMGVMLMNYPRQLTITSYEIIIKRLFSIRQVDLTDLVFIVRRKNSIELIKRNQEKLLIGFWGFSKEDVLALNYCIDEMDQNIEWLQ